MLNKPVDPCVYCGASTALGSGKFINRIGVDDGWGCSDCSGYECDLCEAQIALDCDVTDKEELGHYHPDCLPLDKHYIDPDETECGCEAHSQIKYQNEEK